MHYSKDSVKIKLDQPSVLKNATAGIYNIHLGHILMSITDKPFQTI